jgi:hypothetical protein
METIYDAIVVGNESAGLYWLGKAVQWAARYQIPFRAGWLRSGSPVCREVIPVGVANSFEIPVTESWAVEIVFPERSVIWDRQNVLRMYPELPGECVGPSGVRFVEQRAPKLDAALTYTLMRKPDLLCHSEALWKVLGRVCKRFPEPTILSALMATEVCYWNPEEMVPVDVERLSVGADVLSLSKCQKGDGKSEWLEWGAGAGFSARNWIWNLRPSELKSLGHNCPKVAEKIFPALGVEGGQDRIGTALYPWTIEVDSCVVPEHLGHGLVLCGSEVIPDSQTEMWFVEINRGAESVLITVWVEAVFPASLDSLQEKMSDAYSQLERILPYFSDGVRSFSFPMDVQSCYSQDYREQLVRDWERDARERFQYVVLDHRSRSKYHTVLAPNLHGHLFYPYGVLRHARRLVEMLLPVPKRKTSAAPPDKEAI